MITTLLLPQALRAQLCAEARAAFPRECCGLIEGLREPLTLSLAKGAARVTALHPMPNLATAPDRFEIDPARHVALLRELRDTDRAIIGCYHSHPNGAAEPSAHDLESAGELGFLWLIAAMEDSTTEPRTAAFVSTGNSFQPVRLETRQSSWDRRRPAGMPARGLPARG